MQAGTDQGRVDETGMVRGEDCWAIERNVLGVDHLPSKIESVNKAEHCPTDAVTQVHGVTELRLCGTGGGLAEALFDVRHNLL